MGCWGVGLWGWADLNWAERLAFSLGHSMIFVLSPLGGGGSPGVECWRWGLVAGAGLWGWGKLAGMLTTLTSAERLALCLGLAFHPSCCHPPPPPWLHH